MEYAHGINLFQLLAEVSFFVGTCATLSGLSHAFIFAMAHREIKHAILKKIFRKTDYGVADRTSVGVGVARTSIKENTSKKTLQTYGSPM